jgi:hypothetical protein
MSTSDNLDPAVSQHEAADKAVKAADITDIKAELSTEEHAHLSVGDMLRGTAIQELTPFEHKAALINA